VGGEEGRGRFGGVWEREGPVSGDGESEGKDTG